MKSSAQKMQLAPLDDLFSTQASRDEAQREKVQEIPLEELHPFAHHPFKVLDDDRMKDTADSIREYGVLVPAIARPRPDGGYELIAGHRRKRGCELAGLKTMPVIVRELDDDAATIIMVDSVRPYGAWVGHPRGADHCRLCFEKAIGKVIKCESTAYRQQLTSSGNTTGTTAHL